MLSQGRPALTTGLDEAWYLDHGTDPQNIEASLAADVDWWCLMAGVSNPRFRQSAWELYYMHDPLAGLSDTQLQFSLGGEVDMWCHQRCILMMWFHRPFSF